MRTLIVRKRCHQRTCRTRPQNPSTTRDTRRIRTRAPRPRRSRSSKRQKLTNPRSQSPFWQNERFPSKRSALPTSRHTSRYGLTACVAVSSPGRSSDERFGRHPDTLRSLRAAGTTRCCPPQLVGLPIVQQLCLSPVLRHATGERARELSRRDCPRRSASRPSLHPIPFTARARPTSPSDRSQASRGSGRCATSFGAIEGRQSRHHQE